MKVDVLRQAGAEADQAHKIIFETLEPWPEPVTGNDLMIELTGAQKKHIVLSDEGVSDGYSLESVDLVHRLGTD